MGTLEIPLPVLSVAWSQDVIAEEVDGSFDPGSASYGVEDHGKPHSLCLLLFPAFKVELV